ncbi:MAG: glutathione S-transferase family protein [Candidatus Binataceae bacterium]|nr:glutathione S-transferase family protein [Candidatus Binataceae bacterium]
MKLYGYRNGRTLRALWALEEIGAPYEYVEVDIMRGQGREPWFLKINPGGKVPVLDDAGTVITESAAICMHLAEKHPKSRLLPPAATPERTACYKWISFILTELDAPLWTIAKHRFVLPEERRVSAVIDTAGWEFRVAVKILATGLGNRPYLVGDALTVADILAGHVLQWAKSARLALDDDNLETYLRALTARDAFKRANKTTS